MGCVNTSPEIIIHSIRSFKKETKKNLVLKKSKNPVNFDFTFAFEEDEDTSHSSLEQSQIPIKAKIENNELIFL